MNLFNWADKAIKRYRWYDISLIKLSVAGFMLMLAKLWPPLLSLDWYWYAVICVIAGIRPLIITFSR